MSKKPKKQARRLARRAVPKRQAVRKGATRRPASKAPVRAAKPVRKAPDGVRELSKLVGRKAREAFVHGQKARERTEARLTAAQKRARTRDAQRIEAQAAQRRRSEAARKGWVTRRAKAEAVRRALERPEDFQPDLVTTEPRSSGRSRSLSGSSKKSRRTSGKPSRPKRPPTSTVEPEWDEDDQDELDEDAPEPGEASRTIHMGGGSGDALRVQIGVRLRIPRGMQPTNALLNEAIAYRVENGEDHPLFRTRIIRWQNPNRRRPELRQWRQGNQADAWATLGRAILAAVS